MPKRAKTWTVEQRRFMEWLATPKDERFPTKQGTYAEQIGKAEATLSDWKRLPGFTEEVNTLVRSAMGDAYPEVMAALKREAKRGNIQHIRTFLEMLGEYAPKMAVDISGGITLTEVEVVRTIGKESTDGN